MLSVGVNTKNQINNTGFAYDAAGNLVADGSLTMTYDAENRMISTNAGVSYAYDGDGKRVGKSNGKLYWYGMSSLDALAETDGAGNNPTEYIFFGDKRIARREASGAVFYSFADHLGSSRVVTNTVGVGCVCDGDGRWEASGAVFYYFADHLGSSRVVTNAAGQILDESDYYPFGGERAVAAGSGNTYKFTGKERDPETGLDHFVARYHSSSLGRFMNPDPLGGRIFDPQTLNKFSYVRNNPLNLIDPSGMYICEGTEKQCKDFEKARQELLKSKDEDVVRAARAYGDPNRDNGVTVKFGDPGRGRDASTTHDLRVDPSDPNKFQAAETVTIKTGLSGARLAAAIGHEGSHVADAQDFVATINMRGEFDSSRNLTSYQTELRAFMVTHSILASRNTKLGYGDCGVSGPCLLGAGITRVQATETIEQLLANPANRYGTAPNYGVTAANPGPLLYSSLTTPK
jgi:RHS repeat-associated protein